MSDDQPTGYKKPPKKGQFKPGQSGNPLGRKKGQRNLKTDLTALMKKRVPIREDGEIREISRQEVILLSLYAQAAKGNTKAAIDLLKMCTTLDDKIDVEPKPQNLSEDDIKILGMFLRRTTKEGPES